VTPLRPHRAMKTKLSSLPHPRKDPRKGNRYIGSLIQEATRAPVGDLPLIEHIMRSDIFHSTLDWQSREQLMVGARAAHELLISNRELFEHEQQAALAVCREFARTANEKP
jgi:hypothetical protein